MQRVEYGGLPGQCFVCRQKGHLAQECPRKREGWKTQESRRNDQSNVQDHSQTHTRMDSMQQDWQPIKRKNTFHVANMVQTNITSTSTRYDVLQTNDEQHVQNQIEVEQRKTPQTDVGLSLDKEAGLQKNVGRSIPKATKRHLMLRKDMGTNGIKTTAFSKDATTSGGFSVMDSKAPFGLEFTKFLGCVTDNVMAPIRIHVIFNTKGSVGNQMPLVGFSFPLCGYECSDWNAKDVELAIRTQSIFFSQFVGCKEMQIMLMQGIEKPQMVAVPNLDVMGRRHIVVIIDSTKMFTFGYIYIHEENITEAQALARAHQHWRILKDSLGIDKVQIGELETLASQGPSSKARRLGKEVDMM